MPIFDQGYQHWHGELSGHGWRWLAITRHGIRVGLQGRWLRLLLLGALGPALMLAGGISLWGLVEQKNPWAVVFLRGFPAMAHLVDDPSAFRVVAWTVLFHIFLLIETYFIMILVLVVGPTLVSQDLRYNALPLYFSRPLRRIDYFFGKLGVIGFFLALVAVAPAVLAWVLGLLFSLDFGAIVDTFRLLLGMVIFGIVVTLSAGLLVLAMSSLSRNSRYVAAMWGGMWFLSAIVSNEMDRFHRETQQNRIHQEDRQFDREMTAKSRVLDDLLSQEKFPAAGGIGKQDREALDERIAQVNKEMEQMQEDAKQRQEQRDALLSQDWRPIISYTADLQRLGFALIGSQQAFQKVDDLVNLNFQKQHGVKLRGAESREVGRYMVPQYPWYWSALVLLAIGAVSVWILNKRVTSLDRLK